MSAGFKRKDIEATKLENKIMTDYFGELKEAIDTKNRKIAWCTSVGPAELLRGLGFLVYFPENHGAMLGATRMSTDLIDSSVEIGFSPNACSYLKSDIGSYLNNQTPLKEAYGFSSVPKPDVLVYNTSQCKDVQYWFKWYGKEFGVPVLGMHTPREIENGDMELNYMGTNQIKSMIAPLEKIIGKKLDMDRLKEVIANSLKTSQIWNKCLELNSNVPAPWTFFDSCIHMGPAVVLRGDKVAIDYYETLYKELNEKVRNTEAAVEGEKHRLFWAGIPVWGKIGALSKQLGSLKANVVASTYCSSWVFNDLDPENPLDSLGKVYTELYISGNDDRRAKYLKKCFDFYKIDGILYHNAWTCDYSSETKFGLHKTICEKTGIPYIVIDGDLNDLRCYSEEQTKTKIEALIEELEGI
ncbi:MAG TPA: 2-hydroxyacyl-CoA dehydratase family protein [Victivallales bacterium]|nr:2-hydroxyacyl-CoA dehydratase family protein [Victivallales bacterium]